MQGPRTSSVAIATASLRQSRIAAIVGGTIPQPPPPTRVADIPIQNSFAHRDPETGQWITTGKIEDLNNDLHDFVAKRGKADVLLLDRPWAYGKNPTKRRSNYSQDPGNHYPLIADRDNILIDIRSMLKPNATIVEWVPASLVPFLYDIWKASRIKPITLLTWHKLGTDGGSSVCSNQDASNCMEYLAFGRVGDGALRIDIAARRRFKESALRKVQGYADMKTEERAAARKAIAAGAKSVQLEAQKIMDRFPGVFPLRAGEHSRKPKEVHEWLRKLYGPKLHYVEVFGRGGMPGWDVFGNQSNDKAKSTEWEKAA